MSPPSDGDELDELIAERSKTNPAFHSMVENVLRARELIRKLADLQRGR